METHGQELAETYLKMLKTQQMGALPALDGGFEAQA